MADLLVTRDGPVTSLVMNRPDRLNAVTEELYSSLAAAVAAAAADDQVRAVVLTGAGRAFCVGADLQGHGENARDESARRRYADLAQRAAAAIFDCRKPVVAAVNGHAIGAGLELALACDVSVVAEDGKLRLPEAALGTFVGGGVTFTLPERVGSTRAKQLLLLGEFFTGRDAVAWGVCTEAVAADAVVPRAVELARALAQRAPRSLALLKQLLHRAARRNVEAALADEREALLDCMRTADWKEGIDAFAARREPRFTGR